ncbi:MAG: PilN domain-containing protein [bacterium]
MIRINLLPYKESTLVQWGQRQVLIFVVALLVSAVVCIVWYGRLPDPEAKKKALIAERVKYEQQIQTVQSRKTCEQAKYHKLIEKAERKYTAVERLITRRRTPKFALRELSRILSEAWGPTLKPALSGRDKRTLYNQNWDPTAVWITRFEEKGRELKIEGGAKAMDDVAEFWRRLQVSAYFYDVDLEKFNKVKDQRDAKASASYLKFSIVAGINY